jgi:predicted ATPase
MDATCTMEIQRRDVESLTQLPRSNSQVVATHSSVLFLFPHSDCFNLQSIPTTRAYENAIYYNERTRKELT